MNILLFVCWQECSDRVRISVTKRDRREGPSDIAETKPCKEWGERNRHNKGGMQASEQNFRCETFHMDFSRVRWNILHCFHQNYLYSVCCTSEFAGNSAIFTGNALLRLRGNTYMPFYVVIFCLRSTEANRLLFILFFKPRQSSILVCEKNPHCSHTRTRDTHSECTRYTPRKSQTLLVYSTKSV